MRTRTACGLLLVTGLIVGPVPFAHATHEIPARVSRVANGDTLTVFTANGTKLRVRLLGITTPDLPLGSKSGEPLASAARRYLEQLVDGQRIRLQLFGTDEHKRNWAVVWVGKRVVMSRWYGPGWPKCVAGRPVMPSAGNWSRPSGRPAKIASVCGRMATIRTSRKTRVGVAESRTVHDRHGWV